MIKILTLKHVIPILIQIYNGCFRSRSRGRRRGLFYFAVSEEEQSGVEIVFQLQNIIEYLEIKDDKEVFIEGIKVVGLASKGTIILPVEKTECDLEYENEQEWKRAFKES